MRLIISKRVVAHLYLLLDAPSEAIVNKLKRLRCTTKDWEVKTIGGFGVGIIVRDWRSRATSSHNSKLIHWHNHPS